MEITIFHVSKDNFANLSLNKVIFFPLTSILKTWKCSIVLLWIQCFTLKCDNTLFAFAVVWQDWWSPLVVGLPSLLWIWNQHSQLHCLCKHHALTQSDATAIKKCNRSTKSNSAKHNECGGEKRFENNLKKYLSALTGFFVIYIVLHEMNLPKVSMCLQNIAVACLLSTSSQGSFFFVFFCFFEPSKYNKFSIVSYTDWSI